MFARRIILRSVGTYRCASNLSHIPTVGALPLIGSTHKLFNIKVEDGRRISIIDGFYDAIYAHYKQCGPVYTLGLPFRKGVGLKNLVVVCVDPVEYVNVLQNEGRNPIGLAQNAWLLAAVMEHTDSTIKNFFTQGEEWRRIRTATQKSLLSPSKVNGWMSGICKAAADASPGFERNKDQLQVFGYQCSFDVFSVVIFGQLMKTAIGETDSEHKCFCEDVNYLIEELGSLGFSPREILLYKIGLHSPRLRKWVKTFEATAQRCQVLINEFLKKRSRKELNEFELQSYMSANLTYGEESKKSLTEQEFKDMTTFLLIASVDTTSSILQWVLIHLALYPKVQAKVRNEILSQVSQSGSSEELAEVMRKGVRKQLPYLNTVIREVHRVRPALAWTAIKEPQCDIDLGGYSIPAGVPCQLDLFCLQNDPGIVENPFEFYPERWEESAVSARIGTKAEVLDHSLLREPFSAGVRMCPGSRVARVEVFAIIATLVRKYEFSLAPGQEIKTIYDIKYKLDSTITPSSMPKFIVKSLVS